MLNVEPRFTSFFSSRSLTLFPRSANGLELINGSPFASVVGFGPVLLFPLLAVVPELEFELFEDLPFPVRLPVPAFASATVVASLIPAGKSPLITGDFGRLG